MKFRLALAAILLALPATAQAHRAWLLPSSTMLSGDESWVTFDAAVSNELFYFNHAPLRLNGLTVTCPDGSEAQPENAATGKYRSTFDVHLDQQGTWKIATGREGVFGGYMLNGERKRLPRGTSPDQIASAIPKEATDIRIRENLGRNEVFVTLGAPTETVFQPTGKGLELVPVTHPNDLVADEPARFRFLVDGKPAAGLKLTVIPGGIRYRDAVNQLELQTDDAGEVSIEWPGPGMFWLEAETKDRNTTVPRATERGLSYATTLEVMAP